MAALAQYVSFAEPPNAGHAVTHSTPPSSAGLRKGLLLQEVDAALGVPLASTERKEGSLKVTQPKYSTLGQVTTEFVEGVLIR